MNETRIHDAASMGETARLIELLNAGGAVDERSGGCTPLMAAAMFGQAGIVLPRTMAVRL